VQPCSGKGQTPSQVGIGERSHAIGSQRQASTPAALSARQTVPTGQSPAQSGNGEETQVSVMHSQVPSSWVRQKVPTGHSPSQEGYGDCSQAIGTHSQASLAALPRHTVPDGQPPVHSGKMDPLHDACGRHSQNDPLGSVTQTSPWLHTPSHSGNAASAHGCWAETLPAQISATDVATRMKRVRDLVEQ
jgi:hypothetical protein